MKSEVLGESVTYHYNTYQDSHILNWQIDNRMILLFAQNDGSAIAQDDENPWMRIYNQSRSRSHVITSNPVEADSIVFVQSHHARSHVWNDFQNCSLYNDYRNKCIVYNDRDVPYPIYPGLYTSIRTRLYDAKYYLSVPYVKVFTEPDCNHTPQSSRRYLYSFMGTVRNKVRRNLVRNKHCNDAYVIATDNLRPYDVYQNPDHWRVVRNAQDEMISVMSDSIYTLCPAGVSPNSYRIYEAMSVGSIPVIIADDLVLPVGIDWSKCSIRIREHDIASIESVLRSFTPDEVKEFQCNVREIYEKYLSIDVKFDYFVSCIETIYSNGIYNPDFKKLLQVNAERMKNSVIYRINSLVSKTG